MQSLTPPTSGPPSAPGPDGEKYRYAAFISYRHVEPDRRWAKWLHSALENYRVPRRLRRARGLSARLGRVFRDEEELAASDDLGREIEEALVQSKFLIVICSPRIAGSRWCNKEVELFRELGRHDRILALMIEGEPKESFLPALREIRRTVTDAAGLTRQQVEAVEPLAADVRPVRGERRGHSAGMAKTRLLAQMLGVRFDDLRQRELQRSRRRRLAAAAAVAVALVGLVGMAQLEQHARAARQANDFARRFDAALEQRDWTADRLAETEQVLAGWDRVGPQDAGAAPAAGQVDG